MPSARGWVKEAGSSPPNSCPGGSSPPLLRRAGWFRRISPGDPSARTAYLSWSLVPGPREARAAGGSSCGATGMKRAAPRGAPIAPYAPPAGARRGVGVLLERGAAEAARRGEGARGRSPGAPRPPPIPPPALPAGGRRALRPPGPRAPSLAPSLLVTSWAPAQINFLGIFKTAAARPLCAAAGACARAPGERAGKALLKSFAGGGRLVARGGVDGGGGGGWSFALDIFLSGEG